MSHQKEIKKIIRTMVEKGWMYEMRKNNHHKLTHPLGRFIIMAATPSDGRALLNIRAEIKRIERDPICKTPNR